MNNVAMYLPACSENEVHLKNGLCGTREQASQESAVSFTPEQVVPIATVIIAATIIIASITIVLINNYKKGKK